MSRGSIIISIIIALLAGFALGYIVGQKKAPEATTVTQGATQEGAQQADIFNVPVGNSFSKGPNDALVTIIMFSDFQCPFCKRVEDTVTTLMQEFSGKVKLVWKNNPLPFHQNAKILAEATEAAGAQGKFWEMHDGIFKNQEKFRDPAGIPAILEEIAKSINLDVNRFKSDLDSHRFQSKVEADATLGQRFGVRGTPYFFINGRILRGAQPVDSFRQIIREEIQKAEKLVAQGIPRNRLYQEIVKGGLTSAPQQPNNPNNPQQQQQPMKRLDPNVVYKLDVGNSPVKGSNKSLVTITLFSDFDCPFCSKIEDTLKQVIDNYRDKVRVVWKNNPLNQPYPPRLPRGLHPNSGISAEASLAAHAQGKFWEMHDLLFVGQQERRTAAGAEQDEKAYTDWIIKSAAKIPGLNVEKLKRDLENHTYRAQIEADKALAQNVEARGTPHLFINGKRFSGGAAPFETFKTVIDQAIQEAEQLMKTKGLRAEQVYDEIIKNGATKAVYLQGQAPQQGMEPSAPVNIPPQPDTPAKGPANAKVRIVEFSDFQCPFCSQVAPLIEEVAGYYGNKVRVEFINYPLPMHRWAKLASEATLSAQKQNKFWEMHDAIFKNQDKLRSPQNEEEAITTLVEIAKSIPGININKMTTELQNHTYATKVDQYVSLGNSVGVRGTPSIYVNGVSYRGARSLDGFKAVIDPILSGQVPPPRIGPGVPPGPLPPPGKILRPMVKGAPAPANP